MRPTLRETGQEGFLHPWLQSQVSPNYYQCHSDATEAANQVLAIAARRWGFNPRKASVYISGDLLAGDPRRDAEFLIHAPDYIFDQPSRAHTWFPERPIDYNLGNQEHAHPIVTLGNLVTPMPSGPYWQFRAQVEGRLVLGEALVWSQPLPKEPLQIARMLNRELVEVMQEEFAALSAYLKQGHGLPAGWGSTTLGGLMMQLLTTPLILKRAYASHRDQRLALIKARCPEFIRAAEIAHHWESGVWCPMSREIQPQMEELQPVVEEIKKMLTTAHG